MALIYDHANPERWLESGRAHAILDDWDRARADFQQAEGLVPNRRLEILARRGHIYAELGRVDEAVADFERLLAARPSHEIEPDWPAKRRVICQDVARWESVHHRLLALRPDDVDLRLAHARHRVFTQDWQAAVADYVKCCELTADPEALFEAAAVCQLAGKEQDVRHFATQLIAEHGRSPSPTVLQVLVRTGALLPSAGVETVQLNSWVDQLFPGAAPKPEWMTRLLLYHSREWKELLDRITATSSASPAPADPVHQQGELLRTIALYQLDRIVETEVLARGHRNISTWDPSSFAKSGTPSELVDRLTRALLEQRLAQHGESRFGPWQVLFNGRDLRGWMLDSGAPQWTVQDGVLVSASSSGYLFTERSDYTDFHLRCRARINDGGDSGILLRTELGDLASSEGYEVQICHDLKYAGATGSVSTALPWKRVADVVANPVRPGQWFDMDVLIRGSQMLIRVNGSKVAEYEDASGRFTRGRLGLQVGRAGTRIEFRSIELRELLTPAQPVGP
jgi:tetratricopeptide (TPR) repeat protein